MKLLLAVLFSLSAFAHEGGDRMGGQSGSGTNGCWIRWSSKHWQTIEEITYQENFESYLRDQDVLGSRQSRLRFYVQENDIEVHDMTRTSAFRNARNIIGGIRTSLPNVHTVLQDLAQLFKIVHVVNVNSNGLFNADVSALKEKCLKFSPVILSFRDGAVVIFAPTWNKLDATSYEIMFVHEALRFAQLFHPAFKDFTDAELQYVTSLFFNRAKQRELSINLRKFEIRLAEGKWVIPYGNELKGSVSEVLWKLALNDALGNSGSISVKMNAFKMINSTYDSSILSNIREISSRP